jgi:regulatory protein
MSRSQSSFFGSLREEEDDVARREALERAGKFLGRKARSEAEVRQALDRSGVEPVVTEATIGKLRELELVDDGAFARQWIEERAGRKGLGPRRLLSELRLKGVDDDTARQALDEAGLDVDSHAKDVAAGLMRKVASRPLAQQAVRLQRMLLARGFALETALAAVRAVLPPEGWD